MNLQENIERIQSMMGGVIVEDRMNKLFRKMVDELGLKTAIQMMGDYNKIEQYLTDDDKIDYIKDEFIKINDGNYFNLEQIWQKPIRIKTDDEDRIHQIEGLHRGNATIVVHKQHGAGVTKYYRKYEELPSEILDKLFRMMLSQYITI